MLVRREFGFEAAHNLTDYRGQVERLHGHSWRLIVTLEGPVRPDGMVYDFLELGKVVEERVLRVLHHGYLNDVVENPSAERVALWVWEKLRDLPLHEIEIGESPGASVIFRGPRAEPREPRPPRRK